MIGHSNDYNSANGSKGTAQRVLMPSGECIVYAVVPGTQIILEPRARLRR